MQKYLGFLKISSIVIKVTAWIFLCLGLVGAASIMLGAVPNNPRWMGIIVLVVYAFIFFFFYLVAKMADILAKVITPPPENQQP